MVPPPAEKLVRVNAFLVAARFAIPSARSSTAMDFLGRYPVSRGEEDAEEYPDEALMLEKKEPGRFAAAPPPLLP